MCASWSFVLLRMDLIHIWTFFCLITMGIFKLDWEPIYSHGAFMRLSLWDVLYSIADYLKYIWCLCRQNNYVIWKRTTSCASFKIDWSSLFWGTLMRWHKWPWKTSMIPTTPCVHALGARTTAPSCSWTRPTITITVHCQPHNLLPGWSNATFHTLTIPTWPAWNTWA